MCIRDRVKTYEDWLKPYLVSNTLEILDKEIPRLKDKIKSVQLCFTTDPFMVGYPEIEKMSLDVIKKLNAAGIKCTVLTTVSYTHLSASRISPLVHSCFSRSRMRP